MKISQTIKHGQVRWRVNLVREGVRQRLFFKTKQDAELFAKQEGGYNRSGWRDWLEIDSRDRHDILAAYWEAQKMGVKLGDAVQFYKTHRSQNIEKNLRDALNSCLADKELALRPRSFASLKSTLLRFASHMETQRITTLAEITPDQLRAWLQSGDWSIRTQMGYLTDAATFLSYCGALGWLETNPAHKLKAALGAKRIVATRNENVFYTPEECALILDTTRKHAPEWMAFLVLGLFCGIRPEEIERLEWANVRDDVVTVSAGASKTHHARFVTLRPAARAWLREAKRLDSKLPPANRTKLMRRVRKLSGIRWGHDVLRNTFCT